MARGAALTLHLQMDAAHLFDAGERRVAGMKRRRALGVLAAGAAVAGRCPRSRARRRDAAALRLVGRRRRATRRR